MYNVISTRRDNHKEWWKPLTRINGTTPQLNGQAWERKEMQSTESQEQFPHPTPGVSCRTLILKPAAWAPPGSSSERWHHRPHPRPEGSEKDSGRPSSLHVRGIYALLSPQKEAPLIAVLLCLQRGWHSKTVKDLSRCFQEVESTGLIHSFLFLSIFLTCPRGGHGHGQVEPSKEVDAGRREVSISDPQP